MVEVGGDTTLALTNPLPIPFPAELLQLLTLALALRGDLDGDRDLLDLGETSGNL